MDRLGKFNNLLKADIAREILRYLQKQPESKDTLDGIAQWWLPQENTQQRVEVERAVALLLSQDLVIETRRIGIEPYYQLNDQKHKEITEFLQTQ